MPPEIRADLAHPEAAGWVLGNLDAADAENFQVHLPTCRHCRVAVTEFAPVGQALRSLPPAVEPPAELEARTLAAVLQAVADEAPARAATQAYPIPAVPEDDTAQGQAAKAPGRIIRFRRRKPWLTGLAAAAAVIAAAIVVPLNLIGGGLVLTIPLQATAAAKKQHEGAATAQATARQVGASWTYVLTVSGLKILPDDHVYECWWARKNTNSKLISGGTFVVDDSGSATVTMTTGVDPRKFRTMVITFEQPGNGAQSGPILLRGQTRA